MSIKEPLPKREPKTLRMKCIEGEPGLTRGCFYNVTFNEGAFYGTVEDSTRAHSMGCFILASSNDPIATAKQTLIDAGYTVVDPVPKKTGEVVAYCYKASSLVVRYCRAAIYDTMAIDPNRVVLARLKWTEGDGLETEDCCLYKMGKGD